jgi:prefoldin subunit 5
MNSSELKENFINQLNETTSKISKYEEDLDKLKEYKIKLQGGLETLELLEKQEEDSSTEAILAE